MSRRPRRARSERGASGWGQLTAVVIGGAASWGAVALGELSVGALDPALSPADAGPQGDDVAEQALVGVDDARTVASYSLEASLDPHAHVITAHGSMVLTNFTSQPLDHVYLHLYMNAFEHDRTVFRRRSGQGMRGDDGVSVDGFVDVESLIWREARSGELLPEHAHTPGDPEDRTDVRVALPRAIAPGERATFDVRFRTQLPPIVLRAGYAGSFNMVAQWFPKLAKLEEDGHFAHFPYERFGEFYSDYGDYDVTIQVPEGFEVGATGALVSDDRSGDRRTLRFSARAIGDFAFAAWDGFAEATRDAHGVAIRCLFPRGQEGAAAIQLDAAAAGLAFYNRELGPYPYTHLTIVHPPPDAQEAGGMEYPTLFTTGEPPFVGLLPLRPRTLELVTLHELGHQWFYGILGSNENQHPFLDEGLTSYVTERALTEIYGEGGLLPGLPFAVSLAELERAAQLGAHSRAPVAARVSDFPTGGDYTRLVYSRAATIMRSLDGAYDGAGRRAVARFARAHRFGHPGPEDLLRAVREVAGEDAEKQLRTALFERGSVDFVVTAIDNSRDGERVRRDVTLERRGALELPVVVALHGQGGRVERVSWDGKGSSTTLTTYGDEPLVAAVIDPERALPLDESRANDAFNLAPRALAPRTLLLAAFASTLVVHAVLP